MEKALEAYLENCEYLHECLPVLCQEAADALRWMYSGAKCELEDDGQLEDLQNRANSEWVELIRQEEEPLEASKLLLDWAHDKNQAWEKLWGYEKEEGRPDSFRLSR